MFLFLLIFEYHLVTKVRFSAENKSRKNKNALYKVLYSFSLYGFDLYGFYI